MGNSSPAATQVETQFLCGVKKGYDKRTINTSCRVCQHMYCCCCCFSFFPMLLYWRSALLREQIRQLLGLRIFASCNPYYIATISEFQNSESKGGCVLKRNTVVAMRHANTQFGLGAWTLATTLFFCVSKAFESYILKLTINAPYSRVTCRK